MKNSLLLLPLIITLNISSVFALEIDEKLTLRFLKVSTTKKTILINRGGEDGLVVGDHAKFFITAGVIARGVAEKVSPSRSVWSLYRIVDPDEVVQDKVLNLKIATPVKITEDASKSLKEEVIPGGEEAIPVEPGLEGDATEDTDVMKDSDKEELKGLGTNEDEEVSEVTEVAPAKPLKNTKIVKTTKNKKVKNTSVIEESQRDYKKEDTTKNWEIWGAFGFNSLSGTLTSSADTTSTTTASTAAKSSIDLLGSVERYFLTSTSFLQDTSFNLMFHKVSITSGDTTKSTSDLFEFGVGASYHFYNSAATIGRVIGYGSGTIGVGSSTLTSTSTVNGADTTDSAKGSTSFYTLGVGLKYNLDNGFGFRGGVEYYSTTETYKYEFFTVSRTLTGPRFHFGAAYRF
jgi:hypothetical protein